MRNKGKILNKLRGSITLEYILVSTFAAVAALSSLAYVGKILKTQLETLSTKVGVNFTDDGNF